MTIDHLQMTHRHDEPGKRALCALAVIASIAFSAPVLCAQTPVTPMTPLPAHEALTFFEGSWTIEERPASQNYVETCAFMPSGRRHMVCRTTWSAASGPREGWSIISYRAADSTYLYYGLRAGGAVEAMIGRKLPDGFEFLSETGSGATRERARVTVTRLASQRFRLVASTATGDGPWTVAETEHYVPSRKP